VKFAGLADEGTYQNDLNRLAKRLGLEKRVQWLGHVNDEHKFELYAKSLGVIYPPIDEDFGYVTLEGMLAQKPVVVCSDSGGPLEFVLDGENGLVANPTPESLAQALDRLWDNRSEAKRFGVAGYELYHDKDISWNRVVESLLQ
jgi:glycosyltransferase involved in cell wall biosynthesis